MRRDHFGIVLAGTFTVASELSALTQMNG